MTHTFNLTKNEMQMITEALSLKEAESKKTQDHKANDYGQLAEYFNIRLENIK